jgi:hypothetical protein
MIELIIEEFMLLKELLNSEKIEITFLSIELPNGEKLILR